MFSIDDVTKNCDKQPYRELQAFAKNNNLRAIGKKEELCKRIGDFFSKKSSPKPLRSPQKQLKKIALRKGDCVGESKVWIVGKGCFEEKKKEAEKKTEKKEHYPLSPYSLSDIENCGKTVLVAVLKQIAQRYKLKSGLRKQQLCDEIVKSYNPIEKPIEKPTTDISKKEGWIIKNKSLYPGDLRLLVDDKYNTGNFEILASLVNKLQTVCDFSKGYTKSEIEQLFVKYDRTNKSWTDLSCAIMTLLQNVTDKCEADNLDLRVGLRKTEFNKIFTPIRKLSKGVYGQTEKVGLFGSTENNIVMKTSLDNDSVVNKELLHEMVIGLMLNTLDSKVFVKTFGGFFCSRTLQACDKVKQIDKDNFFLFTEFIKGDNFMNRISDGMALKPICLIVYIVCLGLIEAQKKLKYVHFDLHIQNIMLMNQKTKVNIRGKEFESNFQPVIIDYGMSTAEIDNKIAYATEVKAKKFDIVKYDVDDPFLSGVDMFRVLFHICYLLIYAGRDTDANLVLKMWLSPFYKESEKLIGYHELFSKAINATGKEKIKLIQTKLLPYPEFMADSPTRKQLQQYQSLGKVNLEDVKLILEAFMLMP